MPTSISLPPPDVRTRSSAPARRAVATVPTIAIVLFPIRFFLGLGWLRAGVEKLIEDSWWNGVAIGKFLDAQRAEALPFMSGIVGTVFEPLAEPIGVAVLTTQFAIALGFLSTRLLRPALYAAITLNVVFVAMGAVNPSVFYLVIEIALLAALNLGALGARPVVPKPASVGAKLGAALTCAPYIRTLHPMEVIDDPAIILATVAVISAATEALGWAASAAVRTASASADDAENGRAPNEHPRPL